MILRYLVSLHTVDCDGARTAISAPWKAVPFQRVKQRMDLYVNKFPEVIS